MTHDELLKRIDRRSVGASLLDSSAWKALRAVLEEHIPCLEDCNQDGKECPYCLCGKIYPCPTIQAIEKELE